MSWYRRITLCLMVLLFAGCASSEPKIGVESFDGEDAMIIKALAYENTNPQKSIEILNKLYKKTDKYIYAQKIIKLTFEQKKYKKTIQLVKEFVKKYPNHKCLALNYEIYSYLRLNQPNKALQIALNVLKKHRDIEAYKLVAYIYIQKKDYKQGIKYLKTAYSISHNDEILAEMGDLFFKYLNKPNEAVSYYQTHIRLYGCDPLICSKLADIYRFLYDYNNLIAIYKRLYEVTDDTEYAGKIVYLYVEKGQYNKAINFIKTNKLDNNLLYLVYKNRFEKFHSYKDAYKLYRWSGDLGYFFYYSIYKFEHSKKGLLDLKNLIANLEFLIKKQKNPVYLNYLGYVLIDYDINPKRGVALVKEALKQYPNSPEFLDSLAWGYYKLHKCFLAYKTINKISLKEKEILKHKKLIRRCYDIAKNNRKNKTKSKKRKKH